MPVEPARHITFYLREDRLLADGMEVRRWETNPPITTRRIEAPPPQVLPPSDDVYEKVNPKEKSSLG